MRVMMAGFMMFMLAALADSGTIVYDFGDESQLADWFEVPTLDGLPYTTHFIDFCWRSSGDAGGLNDLDQLGPQPVPPDMPAGELIADTIHSPSLEGNLLGAPATRDMIIYLRGWQGIHRECVRRQSSPICGSGMDE